MALIKFRVIKYFYWSYIVLEFLDRAGVTDFEAGVIMVIVLVGGMILSRWLDK